ncbi:DUF4202 domain-containing protein [Simiduia curdlanivorans]|uniref:DUF4202 domain-containing protein n=1 Tax=Simiduia curdlanivorans TaxID=1492769 RepID=A0ABV8V931_9GAMM|nr:DUF4202 domain-containing protein [Simiduia curdlanivorans]MDN3639668.1 DUF4202 domain-containing protein [Simiduia curdlanivorans]
MNPEVLASVLADIDQRNSKDPQQVEHHSKTLGAAQLYGVRMNERLAAFCHSPSFALIIATRAQHIERWHLARSAYPMDRPGYHRWRTDLAKHHAQVTAKILSEHKLEASLIDEVSSLLKKENLKSNPNTQILEDVACLVFLEFYLADFASKHDEEKLISIIQKTWRKMSESGHQAALTITFDPQIETLIKKALKV